MSKALEASENPLTIMTFLLAATLSPLWILLIGILLVVLLITILRIHPFFALIIASVMVGVLSENLPGSDSHWVKAIETPLMEMGNVAGSIAFVIALAAVIGICLTESGAADKIVLRFVATLGEKRAGVAMLLSGFVLSVPVFFDTVFFLLIPLARALARRVGKNYVLFVMAIAGGGVITHSLVPPTPGPLRMAEELNIDLGIAIMGGLLVGLLPAFAALWIGKIFDRRWPVLPHGEDGEKASFSEEGLPPLFLSLLPVVLPVLLVMSVSILGLFEDKNAPSTVFQVLEFLGNKNVALLIGALFAVGLVVRKLGRDHEALEGFVSDALQTAGVIILITSAGGAFGKMIQHAGIDEVITGLTGDRGGLLLILVAWAVSAVMKIAQGSGTVAMITASAMMAELVDPAALGFHPLYIYMAIGFGSLFISWMNDSGFWVVGRMSGFTEKQTLRTWTVLLAAISLIGLVQTLILAVVLPVSG